MDFFEKTNDRLSRIEGILNKHLKKKDLDLDDLEIFESELEAIFDSLDDKESELLGLDVKTAEVRKSLIDCADAVSLCDRLLRTVKQSEFEIFEDEEADDNDVWDMMYPDEDVDSDDFNPDYRDSDF